MSIKPNELFSNDRRTHDAEKCIRIAIKPTRMVRYKVELLAIKFDHFSSVAQPAKRMATHIEFSRMAGGTARTV
jgi:hypothetical protein